MMDSSMKEENHHHHLPPSPPQLSELIHSLEQATFMAKQLSTTTNHPSHILQIHTSLHQTHHLLSSFLQLPPPPPPSAAENSLSSANCGGGEPMMMGDDDNNYGNGDDEVVEAEETSKCTIDKVEEKLRDCFIKNKRAKRPLSPSAAAAVEEKLLSNEGFVGRVKDYDPHAMRLRALDLIYQFHG